MTRDLEVDALRRRRITDAAALLFAAHGFEAVTVDQIAAAAPCSKRTLYARFASKEAIHLAIVAEEFDRFAAFASQQVTALESAPPAGGAPPPAGAADAVPAQAVPAPAVPRDVRRASQAIFRWLADRHRAEPYRAGAALAFAIEPADADLLQADAPNQRAADERRGLLARIVAAGDELEASVARVIALGQRDGALRPDLDPAVTGMALWASISALVQMATSKAVYLESRYGLDAEAFLAVGLDLVWNGIAVPAAAPAPGPTAQTKPAPGPTAQSNPASGPTDQPKPTTEETD
ncbi:MAG: TetR/AcrR family transcriptional regulator [Propionibacteriaceae bacterium]|nr:TetR/AcrR family transcriptional regulator [Propionibacteriaceae bacterium]